MAPHGATVHDAFPPFPPPKKKLRVSERRQRETRRMEMDRMAARLEVSLL